MNFNNSGNNSRDTVNVNTRGVQLMNRDGFCPSTLIVGYWNDMLSIKIHPALEKEKQTESKVFDYDKVISTAITLEKVTVLIEKIEKDILPELSKDTPRSIFRGVPIGGDSLIGIGIRANENEPTNFVTYLGIFKSLDPSTKRPESAIFYEFRTSYSVDDYDAQTGEFTTTQNIQGELLLFLEILKAARTGMSNAIAHSTRVVDKFYKDRVMNALNEIANKLGISTGAGGGYYNRSKQDVFSGGGNKQAKDELPDFDAPMSALNNINDIDSFMN